MVRHINPPFLKEGWGNPAPSWIFIEGGRAYADIMPTLRRALVGFAKDGHDPRFRLGLGTRKYQGPEPHSQCPADSPFVVFNQYTDCETFEEDKPK